MSTEEAHLTAVQYFSVERTSTVPTQTSCKVITGDVKHIYRQPGLHFVCDSVYVCVCACICVRVCVRVCVRERERERERVRMCVLVSYDGWGNATCPTCHWFNHNGTDNSKQDFHFRQSLSFFLDCFTSGGFDGSSLSGCSGWLLLCAHSSNLKNESAVKGR